MYYPTSPGEGQASMPNNHAVYPFPWRNSTPLTPTLLSALDPEHLAEFQQSAIDPELAQLNFQSFDGYHAFTTFLNQCEFDQKDRINTGRLTEHWLKRYDHLYQGYWGVWALNPLTGERYLAQVKPNQPRLNQLGELIKYEAPKGMGTPYIYLDIPPRLLRKIAKRYKKRHLLPSCEVIQNEWTPLDKWKWIKENNLPIFITEGVKKAASLLSTGYVAIACFSITTHSQKKLEHDSVWFTPLKPEILWLLENNSQNNKRDIYIAFDRADKKIKSRLAVNKQTKILGHKLEKKHHCNVKIIDWDDFSCKGIDDFISKHGRLGLKQIISSALPLEKFRAKLQALAGRKLTSDLIINSRYFNPKYLELGKEAGKKAVFIRSPQNSGKTTAIADFLSPYQDKGHKTLGFTHRQTLSSNLAHRFGLDCYLDKDKIINGNWGLWGALFCVDSSLKIPLDMNFDFGVIDECEQVAWHILSSMTDIKYFRNLKIERIAHFGRQIVSNDGMLLLADADLSDFSVNFYSDLYGLKPDEILVIDNQDQPFVDLRDAIFYDDPESLKAEAGEYLKQGKRVIFHTSGQKEQSTHGTINLEKYFGQLFPDLSILRVDRETITDPTHPAYRIADNLEKLKDYDLVLASSTLNTGVSLDEKLVGTFDAVFGLYFGNYPLDDFEQGIERYRGHCHRHIYVPKRASNRINIGSYSFQELYQNVCNQTNLSILYSEVDPDIDLMQDLIKNYCYFANRINGDYQNLRENLKYHLEQKGYGIKKADGLDKETKKEIKQTCQDIKDETKHKYAEDVEAKPEPPEQKYQELKNKQHKTKSERIEEYKGSFRERYGEIDLTREFILQDIEGIYPQLVMRFWLTMGWEHTKKRDKRVAKQYLKNNQHKGYFLDFIKLTKSDQVRALEIMDVNYLLSLVGQDICKETIADWAKKLDRCKDLLKLVFSIELKDSHTPIERLRMIIKRLGYRIESVGRLGSRDNRHRYYRIVDTVEDSLWTQIFLNWNLLASEPLQWQEQAA